MAAGAAAGGPPLRLLLRDPEGISLLDFDPIAGVSRRPGALKTLGAAAQFSPDGRLVAVTSPDGVRIFDTSTGDKQIAEVSAPGVAAISFSSTGRYLQTWQKPGNARAVDDKNLQVWDLQAAGGPAAVLRLLLKSFSRDAWPTVQFTSDDALACRCVTNEAHFYDTSAWAAGVARKLRAPSVVAGSLSPGPTPSFAGFVPEAKGAPASARLFPVPTTADEAPAPVARRTFFRVSDVKWVWNVSGSCVLVWGSCDVDKTNQSYYGESSLHFIKSDGSLDCAVPLSKEGPIHDARWSPRGTEFAAVYGFMPAKATVFDTACVPLYELGAGPQNCVFWSPSGRFLAVGGFGNLPGDLRFFDRKPSGGKFAPMGAARSACSVVAEWSPCGRYLMTATTAPRLRVDNAFKIFRYNGDLLQHHKAAVADTLYDVQWQPAPPGAWTDRPQSPGRAAASAAAAAGAPVAGAAGDPPILASGAAKKVGAYRPPHASGDAGAFSMAVSSAEDGPGKIGRILMAGRAARSGPPGSEFVDTKAVAKNRKRRNRKKKEGGEGDDGEEDGGDEGGEEGGAEVASASAAMAALSTAAAGSSEEAVDLTKKLRALQKKLRAVDELKAKAAGGASLTAEQQAKLAAEAGMRDEAAALELALKG